MKRIFAFFVVFITIVRLCSCSQNRILHDTERERSFGNAVYCLVTFVKNFHQKEDKTMLNTFPAAQPTRIRKKGIYAHRRAFRIQSTPGSCLRRRS